MSHLVYPFIHRWTLILFPWPESEVKVLVAQLCPTLCNPMDCSPPAPPSMGFSRQEHWSGLPFLLHGIFPNQGSNPGLLHYRRILYCLSPKEAPFPGLAVVSGAWRLCQPSVEQGAGDFSGLHNVADSGGPCSSSLFPAISTCLSFALNRMKLQWVLHMVIQNAGKLVAHLASLSRSGKLLLGGELPLGAEQRGVEWCRQTETTLPFLFGPFFSGFLLHCVAEVS